MGRLDTDRKEPATESSQQSVCQNCEMHDGCAELQKGQSAQAIAPRLQRHGVAGGARWCSVELRQLA